MLTQKIVSEMQEALKSHEKLKTVVLRNLMAELRNREIDIKQELSDVEVLAVIRKQVKSLEDARVMFVKGGRTDLAAKNQEEIDLLTVYLPPSISEEELIKRINTVIKNNPAVTNIGQLTGLCVRELKDVAESSRVAQIVRTISQD